MYVVKEGIFDCVEKFQPGVHRKSNKIQMISVLPFCNEYASKFRFNSGSNLS